MADPKEFVKENDKKPDAKKEEKPEYPRWVYPPDGGPGKLVQTPDEHDSDWLMQPIPTDGPGGDKKKK